MDNIVNNIDVIIPIVVYSIILLLTISGMWRVFEKAGEKGHLVIIPFYNLYRLARITGFPKSWAWLLFIPAINAILMIIVCLELARLFGKSIWFGFFLLTVPFVAFPILGFGQAVFRSNQEKDIIDHFDAF